MGQSENPERYPFNPELEISAVETAERLGEDGFVLVDIREADELSLARVRGAVHIPMGDLATRIHEVDPGEEGAIALICHTGRRSLHATVALRRMGIEGVRSVAGGIEWWSQRVDPSVPRY